MGGLEVDGADDPVVDQLPVLLVGQADDLLVHVLVVLAQRRRGPERRAIRGVLQLAQRPRIQVGAGRRVGDRVEKPAHVQVLVGMHLLLVGQRGGGHAAGLQLAGQVVRGVVAGPLGDQVVDRGAVPQPGGGGGEPLIVGELGRVQVPQQRSERRVGGTGDGDPPVLPRAREHPVGRERRMVVAAPGPAHGR